MFFLKIGCSQIQWIIIISSIKMALWVYPLFSDSQIYHHVGADVAVFWGLPPSTAGLTSPSTAEVPGPKSIRSTSHKRWGRSWREPHEVADGFWSRCIWSRCIAMNSVIILDIGYLWISDILSVVYTYSTLHCITSKDMSVWLCIYIYVQRKRDMFSCFDRPLSTSWHAHPSIAQLRGSAIRGWCSTRRGCRKTRAWEIPGYEVTCFF